MRHLPLGWTQCKVEELFDSFSGGTPSKSKPEYWSGDIPWVSSGGFNSDVINEGTEFITAAGLENSSAKLCRPGSVIVVVRSGILKHTLPVALIGSQLAINQDIKAFDSGNDDLNRWLFLSLKHSAREILGLNREGTTVQSVKYETLKEHQLAIPPLNEQRRILTLLEKLLTRVNAVQERLATIPHILKRFRQSVLAAGCSGYLTADWRENNQQIGSTEGILIGLIKRREILWEKRLRIRAAKSSKANRKTTRYNPGFVPTDDNALDIPQTWTPATLSQLALLDVGFAFKSSEFVKSGIRLLRGENIEPRALRWQDVRYWPEDKLTGHDHLLVDEGEIVLAMDRPVISTGLKIARAKRTDLPCLLVQRVTRFKMVDPRMTDYVYYNLQLHRFIEGLSAGLTGSDLPHITGDGLARYTIGLPPSAEQKEIVRRVEALLKTADALEARYLKAKGHADKLTQSILARAFRGELVPQDPRDEPASVLLERVRQQRNGSSGPKVRSSTKRSRR